MKKLMIIAMVALASIFAKAEEVHINVPGKTAVHDINATVRYLDHCIVKVTTSWGVTYTTHMANVVVVDRF